MKKIFVDNFIKDTYKERILYELNSKKPDKKERAKINSFFFYRLS